MSLSGSKLYCTTYPGVNNAGELVYFTNYKITNPVYPHQDGQIETPIGSLTESTFNATFQQAVAEFANFQSENVDQYTSSDVYGGRI